MTEKEGFKVTNISENGNTGLFWSGKDNLSVYDVVRLLNELHDENKELNEKYGAQRYLYEQLKSDYNNLREENTDLEFKCNMLREQKNEFHRRARENANRVGQLEKENNQLKKELIKFKEWEKYVGHVKREELDKIFKMSIYEIAEGFQYYQERIKELENEMKE